MKTANPYSHFYLYAKGWYVQSGNVVDDLKVIASDYCNMDKKFVSENDLFQILVPIVREEIGISEVSFLKFIGDVSSVGLWTAILRVLSNAPSGDKNRLPLRKPNASILPLTNEDDVDDPIYKFIE